MRAKVHIFPKPGVLDPQGKAVGTALASLGFENVGEIRQGKLIELELAEPHWVWNRTEPEPAEPPWAWNRTEPEPAEPPWAWNRTESNRLGQ